MKIPFDIKYRPEIESGKYKVETRGGHPCKIIYWEAKGDYPIIVLDETEDEQEPWRVTLQGKFEEFVEEYEYDIFIITDEEELTEFEADVMCILSEHLTGTSEDGSMSWTTYIPPKDIKKIVEDLLPLFKKELEKDLPKWKYMRNGACGGGDRDCFLIRTAPGYYFLSPCAGPDTTYLELDKLEKLPKEN